MPQRGLQRRGRARHRSDAKSRGSMRKRIAWPSDLLPFRPVKCPAYSPAFDTSANPVRLVVWILVSVCAMQLFENSPVERGRAAIELQTEPPEPEHRSSDSNS